MSTTFYDGGGHPITVSGDESKELSTNIITIGEGMDYEEIQDAILGISDDSATNPYTLLIMPKGTPYKAFTMLRSSFSATYPWSNGVPRYISIIGMDKKHCVIRSDTGDYNQPCGEVLTNGIIKNLTFIMTNDDQNPSASRGGYCLHIDCRTKNDVGYDLNIEDCDFECASGPCLGIGIHQNCTLRVRRCDMKTTLSADHQPNSSYVNLVDYGSLFCHTSVLANSINQRFELEDCVGVCKEGDRSIYIGAAGNYSQATSDFKYRLLRNVFWNTAMNAPAYVIHETLVADPMNYGNNIS